jgi:hypothetical protein
MPLKACVSVSQIPRRESASFGAPYQFACSPWSIASVARIAGVHSIVWIFAISAETTRRAVW